MTLPKIPLPSSHQQPLKPVPNLAPNPITTCRDYYPFGMEMPGRSYEAGDYRFGFQAQEGDPELFEGALSFKYRIQDPRIGRFLSLDPLYRDYPWNSTYAFSENSTIAFFELEGLEKIAFVSKLGDGREIVLDLTKAFKNGEDMSVFFRAHGLYFDPDWYKPDAGNEYWVLGQGQDIFTNPTGTFLYKYASEASFQSESAIPYATEIHRSFIEWLYAKDQSLQGPEGMMNAAILMGVTASIIATCGTSGGILSSSAARIVLTATSAAFSIDAITSIGDEHTMMESLADQLGGEDAVRTLQVTKIVFGIADATTKTVSINAYANDGRMIEATWDSINKVWASIGVILETKNIAEDERKEQPAH
jgi:RHS repeat-associated protein